MPETADAEWRAVRQRFGKDGSRVVFPKHGEGGVRVEGEYVQAVYVVLSYDRGEYDPTDLEAIERAHRQSVATAEKLRAGHQCVVKTQTDGKTGLVHSHLHFNAIHPESGRSMNGRHPVKDIQELHRITKEVADDFGFDNRALMAERSQSAKLSRREHEQRAEGEYVWKDDLANRLDKALERSTTRDEWRDHAAESGVEIRFRGRGASFGFTDRDGEQRDVLGGEPGRSLAVEECRSVARDERRA